MLILLNNRLIYTRIETHIQFGSSNFFFILVKKLLLLLFFILTINFFITPTSHTFKNSCKEGEYKCLIGEKEREERGDVLHPR